MNTCLVIESQNEEINFVLKTSRKPEFLAKDDNVDRLLKDALNVFFFYSKLELCLIEYDRDALLMRKFSEKVFQFKSKKKEMGHVNIVKFEWIWEKNF